MDAAGFGRIYEEDDKVDDYLLNELSKWVLYHRLPSLARSLGLSQAEFSRIATVTTQPEEQIFQVRSNATSQPSFWNKSWKKDPEFLTKLFCNGVAQVMGVAFCRS